MVTSVLNNEEATLTMSKVPFLLNHAKQMWLLKGQLRVWLGHITGVHLHAKFEEDVLNISSY